jgi:hypothetical protein
MTYAEKLKDPRWQKKRLEVLERDEFTCLMCGDRETELHVHHDSYSETRNPWDTELGQLTTFCKHCHSLEEHLKGTPVKISLVLKSWISTNRVKLYAVEFSSQSDVYIFSYEDAVIKQESYIPHRFAVKIFSFINPIPHNGD